VGTGGWPIRMAATCTFYSRNTLFYLG